MATRGLCGNGCLAAFPLTVIPRTFGISANGQPAFDGSAPPFIDAYSSEEDETTPEVPVVDPSVLVPPPVKPLPNERNAVTPPIAPPAPVEGPPPVQAPESGASTAEEQEKAAHKQRSRLVGAALGGAFASVFVTVCAFVGVTALQKRRREAAALAAAMPERPHLDVL